MTGGGDIRWGILATGEHGIPRAYGSWAELAADPEVDVVYVATPHSAHYPRPRCA